MGVCVAVDVADGVNVGRGVGVSVGAGVCVAVLVGIGVFVGKTTAAAGVSRGTDGCWNASGTGVIVPGMGAVTACPGEFVDGGVGVLVGGVGVSVGAGIEIAAAAGEPWTAPTGQSKAIILPASTSSPNTPRTTKSSAKSSLNMMNRLCRVFIQGGGLWNPFAASILIKPLSRSIIATPTIRKASAKSQPDNALSPHSANKATTANAGILYI